MLQPHDSSTSSNKKSFPFSNAVHKYASFQPNLHSQSFQGASEDSPIQYSVWLFFLVQVLFLFPHTSLVILLNVVIDHRGGSQLAHRACETELERPTDRSAWVWVIMSSKLTVSRLRDKLQKRGLKMTRLKPILASRLDEAIAEEEAASRDGHKDGVNGEKWKRSSNSPQDEEERKNHAKRLKVEDVSGMTAKQLKEALSQRGLSTSWKKAELNKRLTEDLEAKNGASTRKNAPKDDEDAKAVVLNKGRGVLDQYIDARIKNSFHVYEGMLNCKLEVFDAMLNQTNVEENINRFYGLQILEVDAGKKYYLFLRWGRVGMKGQQELLGPWGNALPAVAEFTDKFFDETNNFWYARHPFVAHPNMYTWIE